MDPSPRVNPRLLLVLAGVSGLVLGLLLLGAMSGGSGGPPVRSPSRPAGSERPEPTVADTTTANTAGLEPAGRDPFLQLVTEPVGDAGEQAAPAGEPPPGSTPAPAGPRADASPLSAPPAAPSGAGPDPPVDQPVHAGDDAVLELTDVARDEAGVERATIVVDGETFAPAVGEVFSYGFRLERIAGRCVEASSGEARATMCLPDG